MQEKNFLSLLSASALHPIIQTKNRLAITVPSNRYSINPQNTAEARIKSS